MFGGPEMRIVIAIARNIEDTDKTMIWYVLDIPMYIWSKVGHIYLMVFEHKKTQKIISKDFFLIHNKE